MERLADKSVLALACCVLACVPSVPGETEMSVLLAGIACAGAVELPRVPAWLRRAVALGAVVGTLAIPSLFGCLLPLAAYDLACECPWILWPSLLAYALRVAMLPAPDLRLLLACAFAALAVLTGLRTEALRQRAGELYDLRDDLQERILQLDASRRELELARDEQAHAAALAERARISREIHDSVGHLLTRSLLQVEALEVVHEDEPGVAADLADVRATLAEALADTRRSVHAMADDALDLGYELQCLARQTGIAHVAVDWGLESTPPAELARAVLSMCREALTNAARHAQATNARVRLAEYPGLWQVVVTNDGRIPVLDPTLEVADQLATRGMGVRGMWERVRALGGTFRMACDGGRLTVFASFPRREGEQG